jgi:DNA-binding response OmpR family regulator
MAMVGALRLDGHHVTGFDCAEALTEQGAPVAIDLMVVDLNLPGEDGISLARRLRSVQPEVGIVMVTARSRTADKRLGYESGADIYLTKPVALDELGAAIGALSRRLRPAPAISPSLRLDGRRLVLEGPCGAVSLSAHEAAVLAAFARAPERRIEVWQIAEIVNRSADLPHRNAINVMVFRLGRKLLRAGADSRPIQVIRNWGYQLCLELVLA